MNLILAGLFVFAVLVAVASYAAAKKKTADKLETTKAPATSTSKSWWQGYETMALGVMLIVLVCALFTQEAKGLLDHPGVIVAIVAIIAILFIGGQSDSLKKWSQRIALPILLVIIGYFILYPAIQRIGNGQEWFSAAKTTTEQVATQLSLPPNMVSPVFTGAVAKKGNKVLLVQQQAELTEICVGGDSAECFSSRQRLFPAVRSNGGVYAMNKGATEAQIDITVY